MVKWTNEKILEFLEMLRTEPCLWDPRLKTFKNRAAQSGAWHRIMQSLPFQVTLDELKKKKESLMGYYRIHLNKYKKSLASSVGGDDVYTTNWFAFDLMDSFLRPVYLNSILNTESSYEEDATDEIIYIKEISETKPETIEERARPSESSSDNDVLSIATSYTQNKKVEQPSIQYKKIMSPYVVNAEINETSNSMKSKTHRNGEPDEYDYFAGMIAAKIRKLDNVDDQEELMNAIQNLTYKYYMKRKQK